MAQARSTSITRRSVVVGLAPTAAPVALAGADNAYAQAKPEKSLYERLGGVFAIAAVVDHFSDAVVKNPVVGQKSKNLQLREWHTKNLGRLPGLKFMRTLWVCNISGGPFQFTATRPGKTSLGLEEAHRDLRISPAEFDEVAAELGRTLDFFKVPKPEKAEVLAAFAAHKDEVTSRALSVAEASRVSQSKRSRPVKAGRDC
jgi:hemoglobin